MGVQTGTASTGRARGTPKPTYKHNNGRNLPPPCVWGRLGVLGLFGFLMCVFSFVLVLGWVFQRGKGTDKRTQQTRPCPRLNVHSADN